MDTTLKIQPQRLTPSNDEKHFKPDQFDLFGLLLLVASFFLFCLSGAVADQRELNFFALFVIHYLIALTFALTLLINGAYGIRKSWKRENIHKTVILLNLFLISAYGLNREITVFQESTTWLCGYLILTSLTLLSYQYFDYLPKAINKIQYLILGSAFGFYLYLTLFVVPVYPAGTIGILFFGIGTHVFVPLTLLVAGIFLFRYYSVGTGYRWIVAGFLLTILYTGAFIKEWKSRIDKMELSASQSVLDRNIELPLWARIGQSISNDWITQRILKYDLVYTTKRETFRNWDIMPSSPSWSEGRKHDPLVFLASAFRRCEFPVADRLKILQSITDSRHNSNERLWEGDNLITSQIVTDVDMYADLRLAYTEKYLNIRNTKINRWSVDTQEAIYTFQLPEGSMVTSLSLWINGKEEKGILTSKQKATEAYRKIVGVERRDPSVVHWQEGNTITVRVFPCTFEEERKFKIGITSPLVERAGKLHYKPITFRGPSPQESKEAIRVNFIGNSGNVKLPKEFKQDGNDGYVSVDDYDAEFDLSWDAVPLLTDNVFAFDGYQYTIKPYTPLYQPFTPDEIYLDINASWSTREINNFKKLVGTYSVVVFDDNQFKRVDADNWDTTLALRKRNFSLFPFHLLKDPGHSLVVTKGKFLSPRLSDFKESQFAQNLSMFLADNNKTYVYGLDGQLSTYVGSLMELRAFNYATGGIDHLAELLALEKYPMLLENDEFVVLHEAGLLITKQKINGPNPRSNAPDHLARLFAYNNIMRKVGSGYFRDEFVQTELVDEASSAYVVSPVSSLIVLEAKADYEKFQIKDSENSLFNAAKKSSGAVPEPHEWALIILFIAFVAYVRIRNAN